MITIKKLQLVVTLIMFSIFTNHAIAEGVKLDDDGIKKALIGKTCDGHNVKKGKDYKLFTESESQAIHQNSKRVKRVDWEADGDEHCIHFKNAKCGSLYDMGNGVYHKKNNGKHKNTLKNCVDGNTIKI